VTRTNDAPARVENFLFKKSGIGADAIRAAESKRRCGMVDNLSSAFVRDRPISTLAVDDGIRPFAIFRSAEM
jgi:hypothetical protein